MFGPLKRTALPQITRNLVFKLLPYALQNYREIKMRQTLGYFANKIERQREKKKQESSVLLFF